MRKAIVALALLTFASITTASAQTPSAMEVRVAPGLVWHGGIFGDDSPKSAGAIRPTLSLVTRGQLQRFAGFTFEAMIEPIGIANPHFDERLQSLHALAGIELGRRFTIRPAAGVGVQLWSGSRAESGIGLAPALAIAIGHRHAPRSGVAATQEPDTTRWRLVHISPELVARVSYSHGAFSWMAGIQAPFTWRQ